MSAVKLYQVRGTFQEASTNQLFDVCNLSNEAMDAIDSQSIRALSIELGWAVRCLSNSRCDLESSIDRLASLFKKTSELYDGKPLHSYKMKVISVMNETCSLLLDSGTDASVCTTLVSTFMNKVHGFSGPPLNATLKMMSYLLIPAENTGHRKIHSNMKTSKSNRLLRSGISTMQIDVDDADKSFLSSPGLKVNFTSAFKDAEAEEGGIAHGFVLKVRTMLGMETDHLSMETEETVETVDAVESAVDQFNQFNQLDEVSAILHNAEEEESDDLLVSFLDVISECSNVGVNESDEFIPTPESLEKKLAISEEKTTPPRKKHRALPENANLSITKPQNQMQKMVQPQNTLVSYFKIEKGILTRAEHVKNPKVDSKNIMHLIRCNEAPLCVDGT